MFGRRKRHPHLTDFVDFLLNEDKGKEASPDHLLLPEGRFERPIKEATPSPPAYHEAPSVFREDRESEYFFWGGVWLPLSEARGHFLSTGTTSAGKSQLLNITLSQIVQTITPGSDRRAVVFDTKGDVIEILSGLRIPYILMNINDVRAAAWDLARDCQSYVKADELATIFIPQSKGSDPFWTDAARAIMAGVIQSFIYRHNDAWGLHDVVTACLSDKETLIAVLELFPQNSGLIDKIFSTDASKTEAGILMELYTVMRRLLPAAAHGQKAEKKFSLTEVLTSESVLVISPDLEARETVNPIAQALCRRLTDLVNSSTDSKSRKTFLFIDEARFLGKIPGLLDLMTFGRSKGACVFLSTQVVEGFYEIYGRNETEEIFGNCNYKTILKANSPVTAEWATKLFGSVEIWETVPSSSTGPQGLSVSQNKQRYKRERVMDSEILQLPLASPEGGIHGFFLSPKTSGYKEVIPGGVIEKLKPQTLPVPRQISKPKEFQLLTPWTKEEREKFTGTPRVRAPKVPEKESRNSKKKGKPQPPEEKDAQDVSPWEKPFHDAVWGNLSGMMADVVTKFRDNIRGEEDEHDH